MRYLLVHVNASSHLDREWDVEHRGHGGTEHLEWLFPADEATSNAALVLCMRSMGQSLLISTIMRGKDDREWTNPES